jgi:3'-phosphoadenosine 5'-phosphosulfate sulfotransferase (PAPS reductase)/FAD synthetase
MTKQIISFSGGKDSTAMLFKMIENKENITHIIFSDTEAEFPELYEYIKKISDITLKKIGVPVTIVKSKKPLTEWISGKISRGNYKGKVRGFPYVSLPCYWQRESKYLPIWNYIKKNNIQDFQMCIGIASDEKKRVSLLAKEKNIRYPLIEMGLTENNCFEYLKEKNLLNNLYKDFKRIGCYFCPKQSEFSLYMVWSKYPELWEKLKRLNDFNLKHKKEEIVLTHKFLTVSEWENKFKKGYIPEKNFNNCFECKGFKLIVTKQKTLEEFGF